MGFTTQWWTAFKVKSFKAAVIRRKWLGGEGGGGGGGRRLEVTGGRVTSQRCWYLWVGGGGVRVELWSASQIKTDKSKKEEWAILSLMVLPLTPLPPLPPIINNIKFHCPKIWNTYLCFWIHFLSEALHELLIHHLPLTVKQTLKSKKISITKLGKLLRQLLASGFPSRWPHSVHQGAHMYSSPQSSSLTKLKHVQSRTGSSSSPPVSDSYADHIFSTADAAKPAVR